MVSTNGNPQSDRPYDGISELLAVYLVEKSEFPDHIETCAHGLPIVLNRGPSDHWCGYVGVGPDHPFFGKGYDSQVEASPAMMERPVRIGRDLGAIDLLTASVRMDTEANRYAISLLMFVHGGLTYADDHAPEGGPKGYWWFGFDCSHSGDVCPKYATEFSLANDEYRSLPYVKGEAVRLAEQLAGVTAQ